jgi:hypothetical protein
MTGSVIGCSGVCCAGGRAKRTTNGRPPPPPPTPPLDAALAPAAPTAPSLGCDKELPMASRGAAISPPLPAPPPKKKLLVWKP